MGDGTEIERTFLVAHTPDCSGVDSAWIRQGYFTTPEDSAQIRLRDKDGTCRIAVKSGGGMARNEHEVDISHAQFKALWPATQGRRLQKTRWTGKLDTGLTFELDIFEGRLAPLRLVEVEFGSRKSAEVFDPPAWFGHEVTDDPAYANVTLAACGKPDG